jgi:DNA-binding transcriptional LysR family regulator
MRWRLDDVFVFCAIVDGGGITAAARSLDMPKSTVSKVLSRLEEDLGLRLIERSTRRLLVTPEGQAFHRQAQLILDQAEAADALMAGLKAVPAGQVTVAVPAAFCREILAPSLPDFHRAYPDVHLELFVTAQPVDLLGGQFDMAVVVGAQPDSALTQKVLLSGKLIWVASPAYVDKNRIDPPGADFFRHVQVCESRYANEPLVLDAEGTPTTLELGRDVFQINDPIAVREAARSGLGVTFLPARYCIDQLRSGELVEVWKHISFEGTASRLSIVYPGRSLLSPRCRAVLDYIERLCRMRTAALPS